MDNEDAKKIAELEKQLEAKKKETESLKNSSGNIDLEKQLDSQANTIAKLENEIKKLGDPNKSPKIIQKGQQKHPKYQKNNTKITATLPKKTIPVKA